MRPPAVLAATIREENPDLIMTGLQSDDYGTPTGVIMADLLGMLSHHRNRSDASGESCASSGAWRRLVPWYRWPLQRCSQCQSGISQILTRRLRASCQQKRKRLRSHRTRGRCAAVPSTNERLLSAEEQTTQFLGDGDAKAGAVALAEKLHKRQG